MSRDQTCEERIDAHKQGRIEDFQALVKLNQLYEPPADQEENAEIIAACLEQDIEPYDGFADLKVCSECEEEGEHEDGCSRAGEPMDAPRMLDRHDIESISEAALERMDELPLAVSTRTVFRVDLSTGGPGDWLEVECSGDTPGYEMATDGHEHYEIETITYHFNDWFDHAERELHGDDYAAAEAFVLRVVAALAA